MLFRSVSGGMIENRRNHTRVPLQTDVTCSVSGKKTLRGMSWNLSQGGMLVEVPGLRVKDAVRMSFRLPTTGEGLDPAGTVVWGDHKRQGIQFTNISTANQQAIKKFIAEVEQPDP
jgi:c-di-GMP-binding flagellar brake protein YcgR